MKGWVDLGATYFEPVTPMLTKAILKIVELIWVTFFKRFEDEYILPLKERHLWQTVQWFLSKNGTVILIET